MISAPKRVQARPPAAIQSPVWFLSVAHSLPPFWPVVPWDVPAGSPGAGPDRRMGELTLCWGENEVSPEDVSWALGMLA